MVGDEARQAGIGQIELRRFHEPFSEVFEERRHEKDLPSQLQDVDPGRDRRNRDAQGGGEALRRRRLREKPIHGSERCSGFQSEAQIDRVVGGNLLLLSSGSVKRRSPRAESSSGSRKARMTDTSTTTVTGCPASGSPILRHNGRFAALSRFEKAGNVESSLLNRGGVDDWERFHALIVPLPCVWQSRFSARVAGRPRMAAAAPIRPAGRVCRGCGGRPPRQATSRSWRSWPCTRSSM